MTQIIVQLQLIASHIQNAIQNEIRPYKGKRSGQNVTNPIYQKGKGEHKQE